MATAETTIDVLPLLGRDETALDPKNRILLGKKMRDRLGEGFALWLGPLGCIVGQPKTTWQAMVEEVRAKDPSSEGRDLLERLVFPTADDELTCDEQGRIVLNRTLRTAAHLLDKVVVLGCNEHLEIWSANELELYERDRSSYNSPRRKEFREAFELMRAADPKPHPIDSVLRRMGRG